MEFQSPSLRGSGRFSVHDIQLVVGDVDVSIPFIAGQWSLPGRLRCARRMAGVSIPFIAGQWSLQARAARIGRDLAESFQSPSLRGSGRFEAEERAQREAEAVSIPFIAGQWSLHHGTPEGDGVSSHVSIPFIAGQWSLHFLLISARAASCFNPLHCGAVVASRMPGGCYLPRRLGFNPLHCGAVVASIARRVDEPTLVKFQSPSLRGSGRFPERAQRLKNQLGFNPLHCGAVVASTAVSLT